MIYDITMGLFYEQTFSETFIEGAAKMYQVDAPAHVLTSAFAVSM